MEQIYAKLYKKNKVICLDNFATGKIENLKEFHDDPDFHNRGDIRKLEVV